MAVFYNHYHFVAVAPGTAESLPRMLGLLHEKTAKWVNRLDAAPGGKVWHNYRETLLSFQASYFARLNYAHKNAVKHGLVRTRPVIHGARRLGLSSRPARRW